MKMLTHNNKRNIQPGCILPEHENQQYWAVLNWQMQELDLRHRKRNVFLGDWLTGRQLNSLVPWLI